LEDEPVFDRAGSFAHVEHSIRAKFWCCCHSLICILFIDLKRKV
jgi:hypothetical protein